MRGNQNLRTYEIHHMNFLRQGWSYLKASVFSHHCTDGPECSYAYVFSIKEVKKIFSDFSDLETKVAQFPIRKYKVMRWFPFWLEKLIAFRLGWCLILYAKK